MFRKINQRVTTYLKERESLNKIISNTSWLLGDKLLRLILDFGVNIWLIRYLGAEKFGLLSYAIAFIALFEPIANLGLDQIVIRDLLKENTHKKEIISTVFGLKLMASVVSFFLAILGILYLKKGDTNLQSIVIIISITLFFKSFDVLEMWFHAQIQARYIVISKNIILALVNLAKIGFIVSKLSLIYFAFLILIEVMLSKLLILIIYLKKGEYFQLKLFNFKRAKRIFKDSLLLMLSGLAILIYMRIDQIMLGQMTNDRVVGLYSVGVKLSEAWLFLPMAISNSSLPVLIKYYDLERERYYKKLQELFKIMVFLAYIIIIPCSIFSESIIILLFGETYQKAGLIFSLHIWSGLFVTLGIARNLYLITKNLTGLSFIFTLNGMIINIILNLILIPKYQAIGATIATLISYSVASYFLGFIFKKTRKITLSLTKSLIFY